MVRKSNTMKRAERAHQLGKERASVVQLPYKVNNTLTVLQLGSLKKKQYHTTKVLYPLGFKSVRNYYCCKDPRVRVDYKNEVLDGGTHPIFKVTHPSGLVFSGTSPYMVWNKILDKVNAGIDRLKMSGKFKTKTVAGVVQYGLSHRIVIGFLEGLDGALKCKAYKWPEQGETHFFQLHDRVFARWMEDNHFYPATITKRLRNGTYDIRFDDGVTAHGVTEADMHPEAQGQRSQQDADSNIGRSDKKRRITRTLKKQIYDQQRSSKSRSRAPMSTSAYKRKESLKSGDVSTVANGRAKATRLRGKKRKRPEEDVKEERTMNGRRRRRTSSPGKVRRSRRSSTLSEASEISSNDEAKPLPRVHKRKRASPKRGSSTAKQSSIHTGASLLARISSSLSMTKGAPKRPSIPKTVRTPSSQPKKKQKRKLLMAKSIAAVLGQVLVAVAANINLGIMEFRVHLDSAVMYGKIDDSLSASVVYADVHKKLRQLYEHWWIGLVKDKAAIERGDVGVYLDIRIV